MEEVTVIVEDYSVEDFNVIVEEAPDILLGVVEYQGMPGPMGYQGPQGFQGNEGPQGVQGPQGFQGNIGYQGTQGPTGVQGNQGNQGPQGFQGNDGPQGSQGTQGPQGFQGTQGFQGVGGPIGPQGFQGNLGFQGPTGVQGPQGGIGVQGPQGDLGYQGPQGPYGIVGDIVDTFGIVIKGGDSDISESYKSIGRAKSDGDIVSYRIDSYDLLNNDPIVGSIDIDVIINGSVIGTASLSSDSSVFDNTLSGWTTAFSDGDKIQYEVTANTGIKNLTLTFSYNKIIVA